jgi:hypothetical protein
MGVTDCYSVINATDRFVARVTSSLFDGVTVLSSLKKTCSNAVI